MSDPEHRGGWRLFAWTMAIALVWLVVLPWCSRQTKTRAYLDRLRDRGIDAGAMYYTELPPELFLDR